MNTSAGKNIDICVVGVGATTPVGQRASSSASAVRAGIAGFADHPYLIDRDGDPLVVASAPFLDEYTEVGNRFIELLLPAAQEAFNPLRKTLQGRYSIPAIVGIPPTRPGLPTDLVQGLTARLENVIQNGCRVSEIQLIPSGHSAGLMAIEAGWRKIQNGRADFCLVGGVDSYLDPDTLEWIEECEQLHTASNAWGFIPGEAAGFCLLTSSENAKRYNLTVLGQFIAVATAHENNLIKTETVCIGQGLSQAVTQVLQSLSSNERTIDYTICDLNGEPYRADEFGFMIARTSDRFIDATDFLSPADCWGDIGAASGPLFVILAAFAGLKGYAKGPLTLLWTSSEGGERTAALIQTDSPTRRTR